MSEGCVRVTKKRWKLDVAVWAPQIDRRYTPAHRYIPSLSATHQHKLTSVGLPLSSRFTFRLFEPHRVGLYDVVTDGDEDRTEWLLKPLFEGTDAPHSAVFPVNDRSLLDSSTGRDDLPDQGRLQLVHGMVLALTQNAEMHRAV